MTLKNIMAKLKTVLSSASPAITGRAIFSGMPSWKTVLVFYRLPISRFYSNVIMNHPVCSDQEDLMNLELWNSFSVITLLLLITIF